MKQIILAAALFLTACTHTTGTPDGVTPVSIPPVPAYYQERAKSLPPLTDNKMGTLAVDAGETSAKYNGLAHKYNGLLDLFNCVIDSINNKKLPETC